MRYLGIDVGTTSVKAAVFNGTGARLALASRDTQTLSPQQGWSEQDMNETWRLVREVMGEVSAQAGGIDAICVTGQGDGLWMLDADNRPVRNAILWNDQRAAGVLEEWTNSGVAAEVAPICRTALWPGTSAVIFAWLSRYEPDAASRAATVLNAKDWIGFCLTGALATDYTDATIPFLDVNTRSYSHDAFQALGLTDLAGKMLPPRPSGTKLGELTAEVAGATGLPAGIPIALGALDIAAMHVGAGMTYLSDALVILGTTAVVSVVTPPKPSGDRIVGATVIDASAANWLKVQAPQSGASAVDWLCARFPGTFPDGAPDVIAQASAAPPGANGVLFLPFLTGERAPFVAPEASASLLGLRASTTTADIARAVLEGVAYSLRHCVEATGIGQPDKLLITGGGARSRLWQEIVAGVLNAPVGVLAEDQLGLLGAARLAAQSIGGEIDLSDTAASGAETVHPSADPKIRGVLDTSYQRYKKIVDAQYGLD